jgi:hypothetical protein
MLNTIVLSFDTILVWAKGRSMKHSLAVVSTAWIPYASGCGRFDEGIQFPEEIALAEQGLWLP